MPLEYDELNGMKIREIREEYNRDEIDVNVIRWVSPRSRELLSGGHETKKELMLRTDGEGGRFKGYSKQEILWELPLDKKIRMLVSSGRREGGTKELNVGNIRIESAEVSDADKELSRVLDAVPELKTNNYVSMSEIPTNYRSFVKRDTRFKIKGDIGSIRDVKYVGDK